MTENQNEISTIINVETTASAIVTALRELALACLDNHGSYLIKGEVSPSVVTERIKVIHEHFENMYNYHLNAFLNQDKEHLDSMINSYIKNCDWNYYLKKRSS